MKKLVCFLFLISSIGFSQTLEETIYTAAETFIGNQNETTLQTLNTEETTFKSLVKTKNEQLALVFLQCNKGFYLDHHLKFKDAIATFEDALKRFNNNNLSTLSDFDIIESCLIPLGNLYTKTSDYTNAENTIKQYLFLTKKYRNKKQELSGYINLAQLYFTIGKYKNAISISSEGLKIKTISSAQQLKLSQINTNSQIALKRITDTKDIPTKNDVENYNVKSLETQYRLAITNGHYEKALVFIRQLTSKAYTNNVSKRDLAKYHFQNAQIHYKLKHLDASIIELESALKFLIPNFNSNTIPKEADLYTENTFIDIFDLYATIQTDSETALKYYGLSFYVSNLFRNTWTSQEAKMLNETDNRIRSEKCIAILYNIYKNTKDERKLFEAFQYSEKNKSSILKDITNKKHRLENHPNDTLLIKEFKLLKTQEQLTNQLIQEQLNANKASKINILNKSLSRISLELKTLKTAINKLYPDANKAVSLNTIQHKLKVDDAVLVEYFYGKNNIYQFIISPKTISLNAIPIIENTKQNITDFINLFNSPSIINNDVNNYTTRAFDIFKLLKFDTLTDFKNVIIIPDGLLNFIPFEALLTAKTETTSFSKMPFVVKNQNIAYNSSAWFYTKNAAEIENKNVLGFFPVFENTNRKLSYSIQEAKAIKSKMDANMFMNAKASKINFVKNAGNYNILHLATHASSGDFTTPSHIEFYDKSMFLNELYSLNLNANLVVLSACETGIGRLYKGEGAMSIARGFQYAGTENLLFSLWQINDLSTAQIMQSFYKHFKKSGAAYLANHNSKLDYLKNENISNLKKSPYYWSAFVYYGALEKAKPENYLVYIIFGIIIAFFVILLILKLKK